jgi:hypothetical protein
MSGLAASLTGVSLFGQNDEQVRFGILHGPETIAPLSDDPIIDLQKGQFGSPGRRSADPRRPSCPWS